MKKYFAILTFFIACGISGCEKSYEQFVPVIISGDTTWAAADGNFSAINNLHKTLAFQPQTDSFILEKDALINFANDTKITIPAYSIALPNGTAATGKAQIQFLLIQKRGDMIRHRMPTTSNGYLLESGGEMFIQVKKNDSNLIVKDKLVQIAYKDDFPNNSMKPFVGVPPVNPAVTNFNWIPSNDSIFIRTSNNGYVLATNKLQWINCDYFRDTADAKTRVVLSLPATFTNANTSAFIVYKNIRSVMQFETDARDRIWKKERVPLNKAVIYVTVSQKGDDYFLATTETTTSLNQNIHLTPVQKTLPEIEAFLDGL